MSEAIPYADHAPRRGPNTWAAAVLGLLGLGLIALGGCFLVGVGFVYDIFSLLEPTTPNILSPGEVIFVCVLYACCAGCLLGAVTLLVLAVRMVVRT